MGLDNPAYGARVAAIQECLDIVNRAADYIQEHPAHPLDVLDILMRIMTDIQALPDDPS